jgi:hypothetical protein
MKRNLFMVAALAGCALLLTQGAYAGSRSGGNITIPADGIGGGGGRSTGTSVVVTASIGGIIGTAAAPSVLNGQGLIPQLKASPTGFSLWAIDNVEPGQDGSFEGDANGNGIANGTEYVFGTEVVTASADGRRYSLPPSYPADVMIELEASLELSDFFPVIRWTGSSEPMIIVPGIGIVSNEIELSQSGKDNNPNLFFRYRVTQR